MRRDTAIVLLAVLALGASCAGDSAMGPGGDTVAADAK